MWKVQKRFVIVSMIEGGGKMTIMMSMNGVHYCGLIDTGAQISLVSASMVRKFERFNRNIPRNCVHAQIKGLAGQIIAWEEVRLKVCLGHMNEVEHNFYFYFFFLF